MLAQVEPGRVESLSCSGRALLGCGPLGKLIVSQSTTSPGPIRKRTIVNDRYEIRQSLGKGGMGEVFLAYDRSTQQTVALKVVRERP